MRDKSLCEAKKQPLCGLIRGRSSLSDRFCPIPSMKALSCRAQIRKWQYCLPWLGYHSHVTLGVSLKPSFITRSLAAISVKEVC